MSHLLQSRKNVRLIFHATTATVLPFPNLDGHNSTPDTILTAAAPQKSLLLPFLSSQSSLKCKLAIAGKPPHVYSSKPGSSVTLICLPVFPFGLLKKKYFWFWGGVTVPAEALGVTQTVNDISIIMGCAGFLGRRSSQLKKKKNTEEEKVVWSLKTIIKVVWR